MTPQCITICLLWQRMALLCHKPNWNSSLFIFVVQLTHETRQPEWWQGSSTYRRFVFSSLTRSLSCPKCKSNGKQLLVRDMTERWWSNKHHNSSRLYFFFFFFYLRRPTLWPAAKTAQSTTATLTQVSTSAFLYFRSDRGQRTRTDSEEWNDVSYKLWPAFAHRLWVKYVCTWSNISFCVWARGYRMSIKRKANARERRHHHFPLITYAHFYFWYAKTQLSLLINASNICYW